MRWPLAAVLALLVAACGPKLPEPDSPAAQLYARRCNSCHRLYAPGAMKFEMWKMQVDRMQGEIVRHGLPPLTDSERTLLLQYLERFSG